jgi:hypothetical protein
VVTIATTSDNDATPTEIMQKTLPCERERVGSEHFISHGSFHEFSETIACLHQTEHRVSFNALCM